MRFGDCVFDPELRELLRAGKRVDLAPNAFQLLELLIARRPRPVPQADLKDALWPNASVGYTRLARLVAVVRKAVGDTAARPAFVRTVTRYGYAFAGSVVTEAGPEDTTPALMLVSDAGEFPLYEGGTLLGRAPACGVRLDAAGVSRVHAEIRIREGCAVIQDRDSKNGTWVNGARAVDSVALQDGDELFIGTCRLVVRSAG